MEEQPVPLLRKWYQKKRYLVPSGFLAFVVILGVIGANSPAPSQSPAPVATVPPVPQSSVASPQVKGAAIQPNPVKQPIQQPTAVPQVKASGMVQAVTPTIVTTTVTPATTITPTSTPTQSPSYYTNITGNQVQSPIYSNTVPAGASAQCSDGTYSFSQHRSGTCSHHGGVAEWLN